MSESKTFLPLPGLVLLRWLDGAGMRRGLHLSVDAPRIGEVVAVGPGELVRHRTVELGQGLQGWRTRRATGRAPVEVHIGDRVAVNPRARARGTVTLDGEPLALWEYREIDLVIEGWEPGRIE